MTVVAVLNLPSGVAYFGERLASLDERGVRRFERKKRRVDADR
jgi:hypothetical protein